MLLVVVDDDVDAADTSKSRWMTIGNGQKGDERTNGWMDGKSVKQILLRLK